MSEEIEAAEPEKIRIGPDLASSLAAAKLTPADQATRALAVRYAELLDDAAVAEKYARAVKMCGQAIEIQSEHLGETAAQQLMSAWSRIESALAEHTVASDLGPKLLAALQQLGMTPAARKEALKGAAPGDAPEQEKPKTPLELARERARNRNGGRPA
jgi:hypothetical protein